MEMVDQQLQFQASVPAFLAKLWNMVENPDTDMLICWTETGTSFCIKNHAEFATTVLPYYYKHSNMASFIRQLNMYGFRKVNSVETGALKGDKDEMEFSHSHFIHGQEYLLGQIKRKVPVTSRSTIGGVKQEFLPFVSTEKVTQILTEVGQLREMMMNQEEKLETMKNENEALWGEVINLRLKQSRQQKVVNKLIQFLAVMGGRKRPFQPDMEGGSRLALEDEGVEEKVARMSEDNEEIWPSMLKAMINSQQEYGGPVAAVDLAQSELCQIDKVDDEVILQDESNVGQQVQDEANIQVVYTVNPLPSTKQEQEPVQIIGDNHDLNFLTMHAVLDMNNLSRQITVNSTNLMTDLVGQDYDIGAL